MPLTTPGYNWKDGETVTYAKLRQTAAPVVTLTEADVASVAEQVGASANTINWLRNPDFRSWSLGTSVSLPLWTWTERADGWEVSASYTDGAGSGTGASPSPTTFITWSRADDAAHSHVIYCSRFVGEPNGASVRVGQRLSAQVAAAMLESKATLTVEVENKTGTPQTVTVIFEACTTFENYGSTTQRYEANLGTVANNTRQTFTHTLDLSTVATHVRKGGRIYVKLPGMEGSSKEWLFYYAKLEPGEIATPRKIERDPIALAGGGAVTDGREFLRNGDFSQWLRASATCAEDQDTYAAEAWCAVPADGSTLTYSRVTSSPDVRSLYAALLTGHADVSNTVHLVQDLPLHVASEIRGTVVFSASIYNGGAVSFIPDFVLDTCDAENSQARTNRIMQPLDACAAGAWTRVQWSFDGSLVTNMAYGTRIGIRFPVGSLNDGAKSVRLAQATLKYGSNAGAYLADPVRTPTPNTAATAADVRGLRVTKASTTTLTVTAFAAIAEHPDGGLRAIRALNVTVDIATVGANGLDAGTATANKWYLLYLITNGETAAALLHREDDANGPLALPAGYRWATAAVGAVRLNASTQVPEFTQMGDWVVIAKTVIRDANCAGVNTWEQVTQTNVDLAVPLAAVEIRGTYGISNNTATRIAIAPAASDVGQINVQQGNAGNAYEGFNGGGAPFTLPLLTAQGIWVKADATNMTTRIVVSGFRLP